MKKKFKVSQKFTGAREKMEQRGEGASINRIIRVSSSEWECEVGRKHAEIIVKSLNMEGTLTHSRDGGGTLDQGHREVTTFAHGRNGAIQALGDEGKLLVV